MSTRAPIQVMTMNVTVTVTVIMSTTTMMMVITQLERNLSDGCLMKKEILKYTLKIR